MGTADAGSEFDKLFAKRFNELDSLISSSPSSPPLFPAEVVVAKSSSCRPCQQLQMPSEGKGQVLLQWFAFFLLVVGIALLLMYIMHKLRRTRNFKKSNIFGSMALPSVGGAGGTVATPPRATTGDAKIPMGAGASNSGGGSVKEIQDPMQIIPTSDARVQINMFYAPWCGHCKQLKPIFTEAASKYPDCDFALVDSTVLQAHPQAESFKVTGFPHLIAFLGKKQVASMIGNQGEKGLHEFIGKARAAAKN